MQGIVEQYKGSVILEVQARSCEYSHMFKLDGMRAALLEHIPPLDESMYTRNLGNSHAIDSAGAAQVSNCLTTLHSHGCFGMMRQEEGNGQADVMSQRSFVAHALLCVRVRLAAVVPRSAKVKELC